MRLAVLVAAVVVVIVVVVLLVRGCGGGTDEAAQPTPAATAAGASTAAGGKGTPTPKPVSTKPPLVSLGETVRFETPEGAVVGVTADDFQDPGQADGVSPDAGERLVTLKLTVTPEGAAGTAAVPLPFEVADSFLLVMENDELAPARLADDGLLGASLPPGKSLTTTLAFSVGSSTPVRFVCKPVADSVPVSATWRLD
jgi:hypothetical protein